MKTPLISVLLPFCNPGTNFKPAVESVLSQNYSNFEIILVNNNSDPVSSNEAEFFAQKFPNVKLYHEPMQGVAFALNTGLDHCSGLYIARMDADDICLPGRLCNQVEFLNQHPETGVISGMIRLSGTKADNDGMADYIQRINELKTAWEIYNFRFIDAPFAHPSVMFRRSLIEKYGKYTTEPCPEDFELWLRWFDEGVLMGKVNEDVIEWFDHELRLSRTHSNYSRKSFDVVRLKYLVLWLRKNMLQSVPLYVWGGGKLSRRKVTELQNSGIPIEGFIDVDPSRKISNFKVIHYSEIPAPGNIFIISMVSNRGKYNEIKNFLTEKGYEPDNDFIISG